MSASGGRLPGDFEARWLSLSKAADLFFDAGNPPRTFDWLLASGKVRTLGKRPDRFVFEEIENLLRRGNEAPAFEISIYPHTNEITLSLSQIARNKLSYSGQVPRPALEAQLADVFGAQWRDSERSGLTFGAVLVGAASLLEAMASSGYMPPGPAGADAPMPPVVYVPAWMPFAEALDHVQETAVCTRRNAADALVMALQDSRIVGRYSDTGEEIDAAHWFRAIFVGAKLLLDAGSNGEIRSVELRREDLEKLWPDPTAAAGCGNGAVSAAAEKDALKPAPVGEIHRAIGEAYDAAAVAGQKPPNLREIAAPVQLILCECGFEASANQIQKLAGDPLHGSRRRRAGVTLASERRKQEPER